MSDTLSSFAVTDGRRDSPWGRIGGKASGLLASALMVTAVVQGGSASPQWRDARLVEEIASQALTDFPRPVLGRVRELYSLRSQSTEHFLRSSPDLGPVLLEAAQVIPRFFGSGTPLSLELLEDPEDNVGPELFAFIRTTLEPERA